VATLHRAEGRGRVSASATSESTSEPAIRLRDGLRSCLLVFLGVRVALFALSAVGGAGLLPIPFGQPTTDAGFPPPSLQPSWHVLFTATERQDALWFLRLATHGYAAGDNSAAFFPLYPMLVRAVAWLPGIGPLGAGLLVANASFAGALVMVHGLTHLEYRDDETARRSVLFLAIFPTAFFFMAPYSESTFLLLSLLAFWFARRDRWALAAVCGALAALTRSIGVLLIPALGIEAFLQWRREGRPIWPRLAAAAGVALGPLAYFLFWELRFHDFWAPLDAQRSWQRETGFPLTTLWDAVVEASRRRTYWLLDVLVVGAAMAGIALAAAARRLRGSYLAYALLSLVLPLLAPFPDRPLLSMPRFVIVLFPVAWGFALAVRRRWLAEPLVTAAFAMGYGLMAVLFVGWQYVF
jgi:mannosyltransferase PIG-V